MMSFSNSVFARLLRRLGTAVYEHPKWCVYPQVILAAVCIVLAATHLKLDMDRGDLVSAASKSEQVYRQFQKEFPGEEDQFVVLVEG